MLFIQSVVSLISSVALVQLLQSTTTTQSHDYFHSMLFSEYCSFPSSDSLTNSAPSFLIIIGPSLIPY